MPPEKKAVMSYRHGGLGLFISAFFRIIDRQSIVLSVLMKAKTEPAVRVPQDPILLPGSKSMQKCLLLADDIFLCQVSEPSTNKGFWHSSPLQGAWL